MVSGRLREHAQATTKNAQATNKPTENADCLRWLQVLLDNFMAGKPMQISHMAKPSSFIGFKEDKL
jgi:hypothetical protein